MDVVKLCGDSLVWYGEWNCGTYKQRSTGQLCALSNRQPVHYGLSGEMLLACKVHATDGV